jgi:CubicO group peptidase (beta-lactamase class C family)
MSRLCFVSPIIVTLFLSSGAFADDGYLSRLGLYTSQNGPGLAFAVLSNGKTIDSGSVGFADRASGVLNAQNSLFNIASNSKQFTAMAIMLLERDGKVALDDLVSKFIPELPDYAKDIKVRHLVYHTSGLRDYMSICRATAPVQNAEVISFLRSETKLLFTAGSEHEYSNTGYVLLSEIVQRAAGMTFPNYIQSQIFDKLGMADSRVVNLGDRRPFPNQSSGYGEWPFFNVMNEVPCDYIFGDGGIYTSVQDYSKWLVALSKPGFLSEALLTKLFTAGTLDSGESLRYAYGWGLDDFDGNPMIAHSGSWTGYKSVAAILPQKGIIVIVLSNYRNIPIWGVADELLGKHLKASSKK